MGFKKYIKTNPYSLIENEISMDSFVKKVQGYKTIDQALEKLGDDYVLYYLTNINNKKLHKKLVLKEDDFTLGTSTQGATAGKPITKKLKYRGEYIVLVFDREIGAWFPSIQFRSITNALKYIRNQAKDL